MIGIIVLAAGGSRRLGRPKQLFPWHGKPLVRHAALTALRADLGPVRVVLGAVDDRCREVLEDLPVRIVHHPGWADGMGGSIATGLRSLYLEPLDGVIVMLCDQPLIETTDLVELARVFARRKAPVVASRHGDVVSPPAIFAPGCFDDLLALEGEGGARSILGDDPLTIDCPRAATDLDTSADWENLTRLQTGAGP